MGYKLQIARNERHTAAPVLSVDVRSGITYPHNYKLGTYYMLCFI